MYKNRVWETNEPLHLQELLNAKTPRRHSLCRDARGLLVVPVTRCKTFGDHAFVVAGPRVWNSVAFSIENNASIESFQKNLKTYQFF